VPWVADFRDPWTGINFYHELPMTAAARVLDRRLESSVLRRAAHITTVSPTWARALAARGGRPARDVTVVHNGFDPADFARPARDPADSPVFTLAHVGSLFGSRDPSALWEALAHLRAAGRLERFRLSLVGGVDDAVRASAAAAGLSDLVDATGYVDHATAVRSMREASALLLVVEGFGLDRGMITGKLYEYLAAGRPVVALGPADGDAAEVLRETGAGRVVERGDAGALAGHLDVLIGEWESGALRAGAQPDLAARYTREAQTAVMAGVLDAAAGRTRVR
jgi:glycosyltransferase involved in cell wall biosynthesis